MQIVTTDVRPHSQHLKLVMWACCKTNVLFNKRCFFCFKRHNKTRFKSYFSALLLVYFFIQLFLIVIVINTLSLLLIGLLSMAHYIFSLS